MGKQVDKNDFWFIENNPITKVGVYPYLGKQISQDCEPDKIYYVLRPKEELFRKETLDSLRLIPLIDGHTMIGKDFTAPEDKGLDGTLGDNVSHDTDTIYNDLKIISNKMKEEIQNGKKELSLGYFCRYDKQPGTYKGQRYDYVQRDIIANHLALVDKGRMGADVRVYDSKNIPEGEAFAMDSIDISLDKEFNESDVNRDDRGRFATKGNSSTKETKETKETKNIKDIKGETYESFLDNIQKAGYDFDEHYYDEPYHFIRTFKDGKEYEIEVFGYSDGRYEAVGISDTGKRHKSFGDFIVADKAISLDDEDIEWITVRGTHVPIKKGESKEQAVKNFLEERNRNNKNFQKYEENKKKEIEITNKKIEWTGFKVDENNNAYTKKYEDGTEAIVYEDYSDEAGKYHLAEITDKNGKKTKRLFMTENPETVFKMLNDTKGKEQSGSKAEPEQKKTIQPKDFKEGDVIHFKDTDKHYAYLGKDKKGMHVFADSEAYTEGRIDATDLWKMGDDYLKKNLENGRITAIENAWEKESDISKQTAKSEKSEPEQTEKASKKEELTEATTTTKNTSKEEMKIFVANKAFFDDRIKKPQEFKKELNKTFEEIYTDKTGRRYGEKKDRVATFKDIYEEAVKKYLNKDKGTQDSMEYKTIQGEGKMADKKEKVATIDEDKRKLIDEIGGMLKDKVSEEELKTIIGKAEKIAYNPSEEGKGTDEDEDKDKDTKKKEEGKDGEEDKDKATKDKCGKDEEKDEDKEEEEKKKVVKAFAQKEKLGKEVEDALGTFDHSEMTELEIAKYACDKLDLEVEKGQEISAVKGYLKGLAKAPKATFGYKTVAADSGIQTTDAEFEKFVNKGE